MAGVGGGSGAGIGVVFGAGFGTGFGENVLIQSVIPFGGLRDVVLHRPLPALTADFPGLLGVLADLADEGREGLGVPLREEEAGAADEGC